MSRNIASKNQYANEILRFLSEKPPLPLDFVLNKVEKNDDKETNIALIRSLAGLEKNGLIQYHHSGQKEYIRLTTFGRRKVLSLKLDSKTEIFNPIWDKKWRIIILDLPEDRKTERESLRYLLKKAGFKMLKNSVWFSPYPFEYFFRNLKNDFQLKNEMVILVTEEIDSATEEILLKAFF